MYNIEMMTNFYTTIKPIMISIKLIGIINFSFTIEKQTRQFVRDPNTKIYVLLEVIRMLILLIFTHSCLTSPYQTILKPFYLITFWKTIIAARISETWIIKYVYLTKD